jgi:hypothetical protein
MDIRVGRVLPEAHSGSIDKTAEPWLLPLTELALELPMRVARAVVAFLHGGWSVPGRGGIGVPPMSGDWLHDFAAESGKHDDQR